MYSIKLLNPIFYMNEQFFSVHTTERKYSGDEWQQWALIRWLCNYLKKNVGVL